MSNHFVRLVLVVLAIAAPSAALAQTGQSAIAGVVKDATGGVLPGVTVEASSPALIEKSRSAVTNEAGQYRVVDLRPGTYTVTFTLTGFTTVVREGIVLESNFVAPVNIEMTVGRVEQSITVTGEQPDRRRADEPAARSRQQRAARGAPDRPQFRDDGRHGAGGADRAVRRRRLDAMWAGGSLMVHGSLNGDSRTLIDGMVADAMFAGGQCSCVYDNEAQTQEIAVQVSGGGAENQLSGVLVNRIPRTGGNKFGGEFMTNFANASLLEPEHRRRPRRHAASPCRRSCTASTTSTTPSAGRSSRTACGSSSRAATGPTTTTSAARSIPDGTQAIDDNNIKAFPARLTGQVTPKNKVTAMFDWANKVRGHANLSGTIAPEAQSGAEPAGPAHRAGEVDVDADQSPAARGRLQPDVQQREVSVRTRGGRSAPATPRSTCARRAPATAASRTRT